MALVAWPVANEFFDKFGGIDLLIANAGIAQVGDGKVSEISLAKNNMENVNTQLMTEKDQEEYEKVLSAGASFVGGKRNRFYIPTIKLNNSDKTFKKSGIALGNFFLQILSVVFNRSLDALRYFAKKSV